MEEIKSKPFPLRSFFRERYTPLRENSKLIARFLFAVLLFAVGAWLFKHQQFELGRIKKVLATSQQQYIIYGIILTIIYIGFQGLMYKLAFASVRKKVPLRLTVTLFLKRNLISIFIPAGGVTSLAFFSGDIDKDQGAKTKIHLASSIYAFVGIFSMALVSVPVIIYALAEGFSGIGEAMGLTGLMLLLAALYFLYRSLIKKRFLYRSLVKYFPSAEVFVDDFINHTIVTRYLIFTFLISILIDILCIGLLYISMRGLGFNASVFNAMMGYVIAAVSMIISPFMRGLGAVEISLSLILTRLGYSALEAVAITILYRLFEFWLPLVAGALSFMLKINKILMRIFPALLIFMLGIINIVSSITPAINERVRLLEDFIPINAIAASNYAVFIAGAFLLLTAVYMLKGLRNAWWIAVVLSVVSLVGHLTKAIDYEEAVVAMAVLTALIFSKKQYLVRGNPRLYTIGISSALLSIAAVLVYGTVGFYFIDKKHFGIEFNFLQSLGFTIKNFFLLGTDGLEPLSRFAKYFLISINISGILAFTFLAYTILRPYFRNENTGQEEMDQAKLIVEKFGKSALDYFKTYSDKIIFKPPDVDAFIAYRTAFGFAVALENPVADGRESLKKCIILFDKYCLENGLKNIYYRVPEEDLMIYKDLSKKGLFIGQEGIVDLNSFTLGGVRNKALRNAINKVIDEGYQSRIHTPPIRDGILQKLKAVSDEWLGSTNRQEIVFSQGRFIWEELKKQTIITVESPEEKVIAFMNIIPDYMEGESTYDLIRKTDDAPHGVLDFIMIELFTHLKSQGKSKVNLGFAPMSGLDDPRTFPEKSMRFASEKIKTFAHYKGLRNYKEKFSPVWYNRYLVFSDDYDLLQVPSVLTRVIKPEYE
ncbi:MAG: phosphatidylglycerol lysyltransferase domain-containing protein [Bacteroidales bacterium]